MASLGRRPRRQLCGASVVITGAGSGIGRALAVTLAGAGARVGLLDLDDDGLAATAASLPPDRVLVERCDVGDPAQCEAAMSAVSEASYLLSRLAPALYERVMRARQNREFES